MKKIFLFSFVLFGLFNSCQNSEKKTVSAEKISTDSIEQKISQHKKSEINDEKFDTLLKISTPFIVNGIKCFWEFELTVYEGEEGGNGINTLKNYNTNKVLLINEDYFDLELFNSIEKNNFDFNGEFYDANFDGLKDFIVYSETGSGSGGSFFNVYLFNKKKNIFEISNELSGGEFEVNELDKTVSTHWRMGYGSNSSQVYHFDKNGKIKFTEITTQVIIDGDTTSLLQTIYEKVVDGKIIKTEIDTTKFEGY